MAMGGNDKCAENMGSIGSLSRMKKGTAAQFVQALEGTLNLDIETVKAL